MTIWGRYENRPPEKIDSASSRKEALFLAREYILAFGKGWIIWAGKKSDEPPDPNRHECKPWSRTQAHNATDYRPDIDEIYY